MKVFAELGLREFYIASNTRMAVSFKLGAENSHDLLLNADKSLVS